MSSHHFVTVCVVCVLCAANTPCSAHTDLSSSRTMNPSGTSPDFARSNSAERRNEDGSSGSSHVEAELGAKRVEASENVRPMRETKRTTSKKYTHSYSEEKALRLGSSKREEKIPEIVERPEISERLEGSLRERESSEYSRLKIVSESSTKKWRERRDGASEMDEKFFTKKLFDAYGDGTSLGIEGFERLVKKLGLFRLVANSEKLVNASLEENRGNGTRGGDKHSQKIGLAGTDDGSNLQQCLSSGELLNLIAKNSSDAGTNTTAAGNFTKNIPEWLFARICPALIYHLASKSKFEREGCVVAGPTNAYSPTIIEAIDDYYVVKRVNEMNDAARNMVQVWTYSTISIVIISISGLLGMFVVPFMGTRYYHQVLQFFVALAIGTLCGDALIHLLPHAMMPPHSHSGHGSSRVRDESDEEAEHNANMWKGLTAMIGLIIFFFTERALAMIAEWRKHRQRKNKLPSRVRVMRETDGSKSNNVGEKLCKHKYSSYPYCYGEITTETRDNHHDRLHNDHERPGMIEEEAAEEAKPLTSKRNSVTKVASNENSREGKIATKKDLPNEGEWRTEGENGQIAGMEKTSDNANTVGHKNSEMNDETTLNESESYTVIIREHENKHHGHTHSHGHVHAAPNSMSSVVWMVVMGDGLHNFTDGMAIGAAFAANIAGGFSTAIAVFCHELPHELGDFAVLLKAGMSWQQALFYNLLSSVLCLLGMIIGVLLGATPTSTSWIFAAAAGMFIYIALVDMIPELSSSHSEEGGSRWECVLQALGLVTGLGVMLVIALYEHDLKHIFSD